MTTGKHVTLWVGVQIPRSLAGLHILRQHLENVGVTRNNWLGSVKKMGASGYRGRHHEFIIVVTGCVLSSELITPFMHLSECATESMQRNV